MENEETYTVEIKTYHNSMASLEVIERCSLEETRKIIETVNRSLYNKTSILIETTCGDTIIMPYDVAKDSVFVILKDDGEERELHNF